jgi:hypothetical protein
MPAVQGWLIPPRLAEAFVPVLAAHFRMLARTSGAKLPNALWRELEAGEEIARSSQLASRTKSGRNPDDGPDGKAVSVIVASNSGCEIRGLRKAAEFAGIPVSTLHDRVVRGDIPVERRGRVFVFRSENLQSGSDAGESSDRTA